MKTISREELLHALEKDPSVAIVEVLDAASYESFHLPMALNVPLGEGFEDTIQQVLPDKTQRIVVYSKDEDCPVASTATRKMERLGYQHVYEYGAGKMDWKQAGLAVES